MKRIERCDIYISEQRLKIEPFKQLHPESQRPTKDNYMFIPSKCPEIRNHVKSVVWNCVEKSLTLEIFETRDFAAYKWFSTLNKRKKEAVNSPFADLEKDAVGLIFLDSEDNEVSRFRFIEIELVEHECSMGDEKHDLKCVLGANEKSEPLIHEIKIKYDKVEEIEVHRETEVSPEKELDEEWKKDKPQD